MLTQKSTHPIKPIFIVMLCGVLTASVSAYGRDNGSSDRNSGKSSATYRESTKDSTDGKHAKSYRSDSQSVGTTVTRGGASESSKSAKTDYSEPKGRSESTSSRNDYRRADSTKPTVTYRTDPKSAKDYSRPYSWPTKADNRYERPKVETRPSSDKSASRYPGNTQGYWNDRDNNNSNYAKNSKYGNPTYQNGRYYYASRPSYKPCNYGYWAFDRDAKSRQSVYFHFGYFPYVQSARIHVTPYLTVSYRNDYTTRDGYYLSRYNSTLEKALADIREAWMGGGFELFDDHVSRSSSIAVLLDGKYDYSIDSDDYLQMTADAIDQIQTVSFTWQSIRQRSDGSYTAFADHVYRDTSGLRKTVYVSYTLGKIGYSYEIREAGSSESRLNY